jgi:hypothetical protein
VESFLLGAFMANDYHLFPAAMHPAGEREQTKESFLQRVSAERFLISEYTGTRLLPSQLVHFEA